MRTEMLTLVISSILVAAPAVADDSFCQQLAVVVGASQTGFASLKGEAKKDEANMWTATDSVPGFSDCVVVGDIRTSYVCTVYAGDRDEKASITYADNVDRIGKCLGGDWKGVETADAEVTGHAFSRASGGGPTIRLQSKIGRANARTVQFLVEPAEG